MQASLRVGLVASRSLRFVTAAPSLSSSRLLRSGHGSRSAFPLSRPSRSFASISRHLQEAVAEAQNVSESIPGGLTQFAQLAETGLVHPKIIDTIVNRMNIHTMTDVQQMTLNECLDGSDVIAQARTGTGKTLAFLLPIVQRALKSDPDLANRTRGAAPKPNDIRALIISPTRELAEQIAVEAKKIVGNTNLKVQTAVGGTQKQYHLRRIQEEGCHILVGTPGRVQDILEDTYSGVKLDNIETFVLDEADRLLDIGFAPAIEQIQSYMPDKRKQPRQTLMFSATVPKSVVSLVRDTMRPDFKFIRTVDPDESPTHERIPQKVVFGRGLQNQTPIILEIAHNAIEANKRDPENNIPFKAIVYFGSTNEVALAYSIFSNMRDPTVGSRGLFAGHPLDPCKMFRMSSKLAQNERTRESEAFRRAESAILFSSDVTARGMDFPNVSHVIQIGLPKSPDDYVHRLGRTGRAGKSGEGWLILNYDEEADLRKRMNHSGIKIAPGKLVTSELDMTKGAQLPSHIARLMQFVETGIKSTPFGVKAQAYQSLLGVLAQQNPARSKQAQVDLMNDLTKYGWGLQTPPSLSKRLVEKIGFSRCNGLVLDDGERDREHSADRRGGGLGRGRNDRFNDRDPFSQGMGGGRGVFGGRSEGGRPEGGRSEGRSGGGRFDGGRSGGGRSGGGRFDGGRSEGGRSGGGRFDGGRNDGDRSRGGRSSFNSSNSSRF